MRRPEELGASRPLKAAPEDPGRCQLLTEAGATGLEPATSDVTGRRSDQLSYAPAIRLGDYLTCLW